MFAELDDVGLLALLIWSEARGEPLPGQVAVGWVAINRARRGGWFGGTVREVILKPWQFSWFNPFTTGVGERPAVPMVGEGLRMMAALALDGLATDPTGGATHFYATWLPAAPGWVAGMEFLCQIGQHRFYREG
jgi:N-acetylmuramoyl-L-alanine amidase